MSIVFHDALCLYSSLTFSKCYAHILLHTFLQPYGRRVTTTALWMQAQFLAYEWMKGELKKLRLFTELQAYYLISLLQHSM